jgi:4-amino-4-deoxychorismate lyase
MNYFETIKCNDYKIYNLSYHEKRIANTIGKNINLQEYIYPINSKLLKCKVIYNQDEVISVSFLPYTKKIITTFKLVYDDEIKYKYKSEDRQRLEQLYLKRENADEIIIVKNNLITDTTIANIAIFLENQWFTAKVPLLKGTTRQRYIDNLKIKEINITIKMLMNAHRIALLNAMIDFDSIDEYKILV